MKSELFLKLIDRKDGAKFLSEMNCYKPILHELNATKEGSLLRGQNIVIPIKLRNQIVDLAHFGHQGIVKTKRLIRSRLWYPGIDAIIMTKISQCPDCQVNDLKRSYESLNLSEMPNRHGKTYRLTFSVQCEMDSTGSSTAAIIATG
jgi:Integrase zinc binding domain